MVTDELMLIQNSDNPLATRGVQAVGIVLQTTARIPTLIQQSHLERNEGKF